MLSEGDTIDTIREKRRRASLILDKEVAKRPMANEIGLVVDLNQMGSSANKLNKASQEAMNQSTIQEEPYEFGYNDDNNQYTRRRESREIDAASVVPSKAPKYSGNNSNGNNRRRGRDSRDMDTSQMWDEHGNEITNNSDEQQQQSDATHHSRPA